MLQICYYQLYEYFLKETKHYPTACLKNVICA